MLVSFGSVEIRFNWDKPHCCSSPATSDDHCLTSSSPWVSGVSAVSIYLGTVSATQTLIPFFGPRQLYSTVIIPASG